MGIMEQEKIFTGTGTLVDRLSTHPGFKEVAAAIRRGDDAVDITGLRGSSVSLFAAALARMREAHDSGVCS